MYKRYGKRIVDVVGSSLGLLLLSPLFLVTAALIKLTSRGPVFYLQARVGRGGRPFTPVKFRTMILGAERQGTGVLVTRRDPRVTPIGRLLRAFSIDELPQLLNVLAGTMSLVGPRPGLPYQIEQYNEHQRRRLDVLPGITGWAQVNGRNSIAWDRRIELDLEYVKDITFRRDALILLKTVEALLVHRHQFAEREFFKPPGTN
jgi:lipopolysaccharide/colanic/teichoic acid biosynthesis glycosyltransferase